MLTKFIAIGSAGAFCAAIIAGAWAMGDRFGFRFALKSELDQTAGQIEVVGNAVAWLTLQNYENLLDKGVKLSPKECAKYRSLAKQLGLQPKPC